MKIAVCDDERVISAQIKSLIEEKKPDACIEIYASGEELLAAEKDFDIIFLDIKMDGMNGIDTAKTLRQEGKESVIVFITGVREYVFEAFDVSAFHYLLKPIEERRFSEVFERAVREAEKHTEHGRRLFVVRTGKRSITLDKNDILYIESRAKKVEIHAKGKNVEIYAAMNELEAQMGEGFYRSHRGYLVNMAYIAEYSNDSITLSNGETVYLAKEKYGEFVKMYMRYLRNGGRTGV